MAVQLSSGTVTCMFWNGAGKGDKELSAYLGTLNIKAPELTVICERRSREGTIAPYVGWTTRKLRYSASPAWEVAQWDDKDYHQLSKMWPIKGGKKATIDSTKVRRPLYMNYDDKLSLMALHAPSGQSRLTEFIISMCILNLSGRKKPWVLFGDLNLDPEKMKKLQKWLSGALGVNVEVARDEKRDTHVYGPKKKPSTNTLDYAVHSAGLKVKVTALGVFSNCSSDHLPIQVDIG